MSAGGCGGGGCTCGGGARPAGRATPAAPASINGIALHPPGQAPDAAQLRELAWAELLRQEAVRQQLLPRHLELLAPALSAGDHEVIEAMLERAIAVPQPTEEECRRYHQASPDRYTEGRMVRVRHILFAVTDGVDVRALCGRAEQALLELSRKDVDPGRFAQMARELSNCPSGAAGGDLGWLGPHDCADELASELFGGQKPLNDAGLRPRLVHSRYGFHIIDVLERKAGRQLPFDEVRDRIAVQLAQQSRAKALHQYIRLLAGKALIEGVSLEAADSLLVQ
jgi:peptidyl-prolyl cis-trans isomerase C